MKHCQWCDTSFLPAVKYQIYCSPECREAATKEKIAQRYAIERRNKMMKKERKCRHCGSKLSAYNDDQICFSCIVDPNFVRQMLKEIKRLSEDETK
jgi:predicted nucleic acid-binding Zn ribbon protein